MTGFGVPIRGAAGKKTIVATARALADVSAEVAALTKAAATAQAAASANTFSLANANTDELQEGQYNLYFTPRRAEDAVGGILANSANITLAYVGGTSITANLTPITFGASGSLYAFTFDTYGRVVDYRTPSTTDLAEGTNLYFTVARVLATILAGLSTATNAVITAADSVLVALGKLQAQITATNAVVNPATSAFFTTIAGVPITTIAGDFISVSA